MIVDQKNKAKSLNTSPNDLNAEISLNRSGTSYNNLSDKFKCLKKDFVKQFAHIYAGRLSKSKENLQKKCVLKWGESVPLRKLSELNDENPEKCIVIGTLFKHQELKPSILKEISEENQLIPQPPRSNYVSDKDMLILEDEIQRIRLIGSLNVNKLVTGVVIALMGSENSDGKFEVEDYCYCGVNNSIEKPVSTIADDRYIVLVSGLSLSSSADMFALDLFSDWLTGLSCGLQDQEKVAKISRLIIAGNSLHSSHKTGQVMVVNTEIEENTNVLTSIKTLDSILLNFVKTINVDVMPGEYDPSNHVLPQQPMHFCMFPESSKYATFQGVTNPYQCSLSDRIVLGTSGQPVDDIKSLTDIEDSLTILENTLHWGHLAPTAPDTLPCYPYYQDDPFVIMERPDIYFAGNQPEFKTKLVEFEDRPVRLVCIPSFAKTPGCVLINLKDLDCTFVKFGAF